MATCPTCGQSISSGVWTFDVDAARLLIDGRSIRLSRKEAVIVGLLLKHLGKPVHKDTFIMCMYGDEEPGDAGNNLDVLICRTRKKLRGTRLEVVNHYGFGYSITLAPMEKQG